MWTSPTSIAFEWSRVKIDKVLTVAEIEQRWLDKIEELDAKRYEKAIVLIMSSLSYHPNYIILVLPGGQQVEHNCLDWPISLQMLISNK